MLVYLELTEEQLEGDREQGWFIPLPWAKLSKSNAHMEPKWPSNAHMEPKWPSCLQGVPPSDWSGFEWSQRYAQDIGEGVWWGAGSMCV